MRAKRTLKAPKNVTNRKVRSAPRLNPPGTASWIWYERARAIRSFERPFGGGAPWTFQRACSSSTFIAANVSAARKLGTDNRREPFKEQSGT
jgi:hypothetical protein